MINLKIFAKLVMYFLNHTNTKLYKTKMNKLLFYTQFLYYKEYKENLLNGIFICDYYGPVLENIDLYLEVLESKNFIELNSTNYGLYIEPKGYLNDKVYTEKELFILKRVLNKFKDYTSYDISEYSHKENLWKDTNLKEIIPLEKAGELNDF